MQNQMSTKSLIDVFSGPGGNGFVQACGHVKSQVPEKIQVNGKTMTHYPLFYVPENDMYYYFDEKYGGDLFTKEDALLLKSK